MGTLGRKCMIAGGTIALWLATLGYNRQAIAREQWDDPHPVGGDHSLGEADATGDDGCSCSTEGEPQPVVVALISFAAAAFGLRELLRRGYSHDPIDR